MEFAPALPAARCEEDIQSALLPPQPKCLRETGLELQLIVELAAKAMYVAGRTHLPILATRLRLSINVLREALDFMVAEQLAEVAWRGDADIDVQYQLTAAGKLRAAGWLERSPYQGPAPVTLEAWRAMAARQAAQLPVPSAEDVEAVFGEAGLEPAVRNLIGAAMHAGRSMLLYGPPGSGKSTLARKLGRLLQGTVLVPHAVAVGQEIIQLYDPAVHLPPSLPPGAAGRQPLERRSTDARWVLCQRPVVQLGAELDESMLELRHDAFSGCYQAPPHCKASHGLFIIDDLGRQRLSAPALLNRLIQPLDAGQDQLSLQGGHKFSMPFQAMLVFATNLAPQALLDGSALRRLGYKIHVGALSEASYRSLFRLQCRAAGVALDDAGLRYLIEELHRGSGQPLLASYPREILGRIADFAGYAGQAPRLSVAALDQAWSSMFAACWPAEVQAQADAEQACWRARAA
ncbi:ATP-binding protein [Massilia sp. FT127W]|uniref:ATP-binding protein n=2 Tax=Pseudoduganella aquatica TaxID=2660641 RepID=A0A7X4HH86_9BURK|nr:ATP-binding protein [Pseudoduganella aquatica]